MPVITPTRSTIQAGIEVITWANMANGDTGEPVLVTGQAGAIGCLQAEGTFGGGTLALQGSNIAGGAGAFRAITDIAGNGLSLTAAGLEDFSTAAAFLRPSLAGGTAGSVTVSMVVRW
jgi:phage-related tail protein